MMLQKAIPTKKKIKLDGNGLEEFIQSKVNDRQTLKRISVRRTSVPKHLYLLIINKGILIQTGVSFSLLGLKVMEIDAEVVVGSLDRYIKYAEQLGKTSIVGAPLMGLVEPGTNFTENSEHTIFVETRNPEGC